MIAAGERNILELKPALWAGGRQSANKNGMAEKTRRLFVGFVIL